MHFGNVHVNIILCPLANRKPAMACSQLGLSQDSLISMVRGQCLYGSGDLWLKKLFLNTRIFLFNIIKCFSSYKIIYQGYDFAVY